MGSDDARQSLNELLQEWRQNPLLTYTKIGQDSETWYSQATQMRRAAELLWPDVLRTYQWFQEADAAGAPPVLGRPPVYGPYMMLSGLSLELLAKALLIERNPRLVDHGKLTDWPGGGHDLLSLVRQTGITLDAEDGYLVERLGESVVWVGRYPIPKKAEKMAPRRTPHGELAAPGDFHPDRDTERIDAIWEQLKGSYGVTVGPP